MMVCLEWQTRFPAPSGAPGVRWLATGLGGSLPSLEPQGP